MDETVMEIDCRLISDAAEIEAAMAAIADEPFMEKYRDRAFRQQHAAKLARYAYVAAEYHDDKPVALAALYANNLDSGVVYLTLGAIAQNIKGILKCRILQRLGELLLGQPVMKQMKRARLAVHEDNLHARRMYECAGFKYTGERDAKMLYMENDLRNVLCMWNGVTGYPVSRN